MHRSQAKWSLFVIYGVALSALMMIQLNELSLGYAQRARPQSGRLLSERALRVLNTELSPYVVSITRVAQPRAGVSAMGSLRRHGQGLWIAPRLFLTAEQWLTPSLHERSFSIQVSCLSPLDSQNLPSPRGQQVRQEESQRASRQQSYHRDRQTSHHARYQTRHHLPYQVNQRLEQVATPQRIAEVIKRSQGDGWALLQTKRPLKYGECEAQRPLSLSQLTELIEESDERRAPLLYAGLRLYAVSSPKRAPHPNTVLGRAEGPLAFYWLISGRLAPGTPVFDRDGRFRSFVAGVNRGSLDRHIGSAQSLLTPRDALRHALTEVKKLLSTQPSSL